MSFARKIILTAGLLAGCSTPALATVIDVSSSLALNARYGTSDSGYNGYAASFNAASALGTGSFAESYVVNAASLHFAWNDDPDSAYSTGSYHRPWSYGAYWYAGNVGGRNEYRRWGYEQYENYYRQPGESATIYMGTRQLTAASTTPVNFYQSRSNAYSGLDSSSEGYYRYYRCGFLGLYTCSEWVSFPVSYYTDYTSQTYDYFSGTTGSFSLDVDLFGLGGTALADLLSDGVLPFFMNMSGDAYLSRATLTLDISQRNNVAEPGLLALLGVGLAGLAAIKRRAG